MCSVKAGLNFFFVLKGISDDPVESSDFYNANPDSTEGTNINTGYFHYNYFVYLTLFYIIIQYTRGKYKCRSVCSSNLTEVIGLMCHVHIFHLYLFCLPGP